MGITTIALIVSVITALVAVLLLRKRSTARSQEQSKGTTYPSAGSAVAVIEQEATAPMAAAIHFGTDISNPAVTLRPLPLSDLDAVAKTQPMEPSLGVASRISSLMQAAPSLLVAEAHRGRQLMEVVIDGKLTRAADGNGWRAFSMGEKGIKEHARLFETKDLTTLVNAAAVWQLASVVVAQKHMADISQKLDEIKDAVNSISDFLESGRRAVIHGTYQYLQQGYEALSQGELPPAIRNELESCERDLLAVQHHLLANIKRRVQETPRDDDTFGTESLYKNSVKKYREIEQIVDDLKVCSMTRALAWYVLSLYPGEQALKDARCESIKQGLAELKNLQDLVQYQAITDSERFKAFWNRNKTLATRKKEVRDKADEVREKLEVVRAGTISQLETSQTMLLERDHPTQLFVELIDGRVSQVRQRELVATSAVL
ncbi:hypothetical protein [Candidatus Igneacidithiobacillus taiwanensis]|uniref:hypothetical protein n=1 Tax=Candidatus Igneacidithiobacillus taiwanensis TaxID=1945924 RepID=UPI0028A0F992|nr:hypothetical protein [Candidatus Igneacidithiobacillus taiwanensis]